MATFKAIVIDKAESGQTVRLTDFDDKDLMDGDVTVAVEWSTVNYKDGLAVTGKAPVVRRFPMIAGVDFAGTVEFLVPSGLEGRRQGHSQWLGSGRDASRRLRREGARQGRLVGAVAGGHERARRHGDRYRGLYRNAVGDGARARGPDAGARPDDCDRRRRRRRLGSGGVARQARLRGDRLDWPADRSGLSQGTWRDRSHRTQGTFRHAAAARPGALGRRYRRGRLDYACQCAFDDTVRRNRRRLWACGRNGLARHSCAVHFAWGVARRDRFR